MISKQKKLFNIDDRTRSILENICISEGITATEFLRLVVRAWRAMAVFQKEFPECTDWQKAKLAVLMAQQDMDEMKKLGGPVG